MSKKFKPDVRLIRSKDKSEYGLLRGYDVIWLPAHIAEFLWTHGVEALGPEIAQVCLDAGFVNSIPEGGSIMANIRTKMFLDEICNGFPEECTRALSSVRFIFLGCGGLGSNTAVMLASLGAKRFTFIDADTIETSNLNRLLWAWPDAIGKSKVNVLSDFIKARFEVSDIVSIATYFGAEEMNEVFAHVGNEPKFVFLTIDKNSTVREMARILHRYSNAPYVYAGYAGRYCMAGPIVLKNSDPCPYCGTSRIDIVDDANFIAPSAAPNNHLIASYIACQVVRTVSGHNSQLEKNLWMFDIVSGKSQFKPIKKDKECEVCG